MQRSDFYIGLEFWCGGKRWRCTDVGSRVIVVISLEPGEVVQMTLRPDGTSSKQRSITNNPSWLAGPPYAVAEYVFNEFDMEGCTLEPPEL